MVNCSATIIACCVTHFIVPNTVEQQLTSSTVLARQHKERFIVFNYFPLPKQSVFWSLDCFVDGGVPDIDESLLNLLAKTMNPQAVLARQHKERFIVFNYFPLPKQSVFRPLDCFVDGGVPDKDESLFNLLAKTMNAQAVIVRQYEIVALC